MTGETGGRKRRLFKPIGGALDEIRRHKVLPVPVHDPAIRDISVNWNFTWASVVGERAFMRLLAEPVQLVVACS